MAALHYGQRPTHKMTSGFGFGIDVPPWPEVQFLHAPNHASAFVHLLVTNTVFHTLIVHRPVLIINFNRHIN